MPSPAYPPNDKRPAVPSGSTTQVQMYAGQPSNHQTMYDNKPPYTVPFNSKRPAALGGPPAQAQKYAGQPGNRQAIYDAEHEKENTRSDEPQRVGGSASFRSIPIRAVTPTRIPKPPVPNRTKSVDINDPIQHHHARAAQMLASEPPEHPTLTRAYTIPHPPPTGRNTDQRHPDRIDEEELPEEPPRHTSGQPSDFSWMNIQTSTDEALARWERMVTLQERLARIPKRKGHTYGTLDVSEGARAVRGNVYDDTNPEVTAIFSSSNVYGNAKAHGQNSIIYDTDMSSKDLHKIANGENLPHYGRRRPPPT